MSDALTTWRSERHSEILAARTTAESVAGQTPEEVIAGQALSNYLLVATAEFQGFCSDLYDEAVSAVIDHLRALVGIRQEMVSIVWQALTQDTRLSKGNPNHPNLKADFSRLKVDVREPALVRAGPTQAGDTKILQRGFK